MDDAPADLPVLSDDRPEDWSRPLEDRQLRMLGELAEIGLECARFVERQTRIEPPPSAAEIALAYARVSRAVRQAILLQTRRIDEIKGAAVAQTETAREAEAAPAEFRYTPAEARKARVARIVERLAEADHPEDEAAIDVVMADAIERLDDDDRYGDLLDRPVSEIVARICQDLGLSPDWSRLAQEPWAQAERAAGAPGWPLAGVNDVASSPVGGGERGVGQIVHDLPRRPAGPQGAFRCNTGEPPERGGPDAPVAEPMAEGASGAHFAQTSAFWDSFLPEADAPKSRSDSS